MTHQTEPNSDHQAAIKSRERAKKRATYVAICKAARVLTETPEVASCIGVLDTPATCRSFVSNVRAGLVKSWPSGKWSLASDDGEVWALYHGPADRDDVAVFTPGRRGPKAGAKVIWVTTEKTQH